MRSATTRPKTTWCISAAILPEVTRIVVLVGAAMSLNLLIGNAGLISMGQGMFLGLGAYVVAVANVKTRDFIFLRYRKKQLRPF